MSRRWASAARIPLAAAVLAGMLLLGGGMAQAADRAPGRGSQDIDLVVLVDTSESMFPYFDELVTYLVQDLLTTRLHKGDTFHLLSFSSLPEEEISLEVNSDDAARQAFRRVLLLHALGKYTDLVSALQYLYQYVKELPETNPKRLIIITDGVHDPPPGSPYAADAATVRGLIVSSAQAMRREGWDVTLLKVPPEPAPADHGASSYLGDISAALGVPVIPYPRQDKTSITGVATGYPTLIFPPALGPVGNSFTAAFRLKNWKNEPIILSLSSVQSEGSELLARKVSVTVTARSETAFNVPLRLPMSYPRGSHDAAVHLVFDDDPRISPTDGTLSFTYTGKGGLPIPRLTFLYVLYILLGLAALYLLVRLFLYLRKKLGEAPLVGLARGNEALDDAPMEAGESTGHGGSAGRGGARAGSMRTAVAARSPVAAPRAVSRSRATPQSRAPVPSPAAPRSRASRVPLVGRSTPPTVPLRPTVTSIRKAFPRPDGRASLPPLIEMRVQQQSRRIGFRNVHRIAPGAVKTVGGRLSSFLVFLVPVPSRIAEIRNVDGRYVFTPVRADLFPGLSGPVEDCIGKGIPFMSPSGKEQMLYFLEWESPLDEVNRVLGQTRSRE